MTTVLEKEIRARRDGTHPDLPKTIRAFQERKVLESCCISCLGGAAEGDPPVDPFTACCGQPYHASCYLRQLEWAAKKKKTSEAGGGGGSNKCGVCRQLLPTLESCETAAMTTPATNNKTNTGGGVRRNQTFPDGDAHLWSSSSSSSSSSDTTSSSSNESISIISTNNTNDSNISDEDDSDSSSDDNSSSSSSLSFLCRCCSRCRYRY